MQSAPEGSGHLSVLIKKRGFMCTISVIVPVYNAISWLEECLNSILSQTYSNFELIMVDDGSTDGSALLCDTYATLEDRVRVVHQDNSGVATARNRGLEEIRGQWIAFVDADDAVHPRYLEYLLGLCRRHDCDVVQCRQMRSEQFDPALFGVEVDDAVLYEGQQMQWGLCGRSNTRSMLWCKLFRRELFDGVRFPAGLIHEDEAAMHHLLANARRMAFTTSKFYLYRTTPDSIMNKPLSARRLDIVPILEERREFYRKRGWLMLYYATAQRLAFEANGLYRRFHAQGDGVAMATLEQAYRENWESLRYSPLLEPDTRRLHELWLTDPLAGEPYPYWAQMAHLSDEMLERLERSTHESL